MRIKPQPYRLLWELVKPALISMFEAMCISMELRVCEACSSPRMKVHKGMFHKVNPKHLDWYLVEFAARRNTRDLDTID